MSMSMLLSIADLSSAFVVGAGGAGLRAALGLAQSGLDPACLTKFVKCPLFHKLD